MLPEISRPERLLKGRCGVLLAEFHSVEQRPHPTLPAGFGREPRVTMVPAHLIPFVPPPVGPTEAESWPPSRDEMFRWRKWKPGPKMAPCFPSGIKPAGKGGLGVQSDNELQGGGGLSSLEVFESTLSPAPHTHCTPL